MPNALRWLRTIAILTPKLWSRTSIASETLAAPASANPSGRERVGNWLIRKPRRILASAACALIVASASYALWARQPGNQPGSKHQVPSATRVRDIHDGKLDRAIGTLSALEKQSPQSSLVKFYLSMAFDHDAKKLSDADSWLRRAVAAPDADTCANKLGADPSGSRHYLVHHADSRMNGADVMAEIIDNGTRSRRRQRCHISSSGL